MGRTAANGCQRGRNERGGREATESEAEEAAGRAHAAIRARHAGATGGGLTLAEPGAGEEGRLTLVAGNQGGISLVKEDEEP